MPPITRTKASDASKTADHTEDFYMRDGNDEGNWIDEDEELRSSEGEPDEGDDDADEVLQRLSEQYRRFSGSRRGILSDEDESGDETHGDVDPADTDRGSHDNEAHDRDDNVRQELQEAFQQFAQGTPGARSTLAENMARIFPGAVSLGLMEGLQAHEGGRSAIRDLIAGVRRRDDLFLLMETLNELSHRLLMMSSLLADSLPSYELSRALVDILIDPILQNDFNLQLAACTCVVNFVNIRSSFSHDLVREGIIEALQAKLIEIDYIDLAEQALQALHKISKVAGTSILRKNCLGSCLMYLDFLNIHAQRKAVEIAANSVISVKESEFYLVEDVLPILHRIVIEYSDSQLVDSSWLAVTRLAKGFQSNDVLSRIISDEVLNKIMLVVSSSETAFATSLKLINTLSIAGRNQQLSKSIIKSGKTVESLNCALSRYSKSTEVFVSIETLMGVPRELLFSILDLITNILPPDDILDITSAYGSQPKDYSENESEYLDFANQTFELLLNIYQSTVVFEIRQAALLCLLRIIVSVEEVKQLKPIQSITPLLASIVSQNKGQIKNDNQDTKPLGNLVLALAIILRLIKKDADTFLGLFEREGLFADSSSLLELVRKNQQDVDPSIQNEEQYYGVNEAEEEFHDDSDDYDDEDDDYSSDEQPNPKPTILKPTFKPISIAKLLETLIHISSSIEQNYLSKKAPGFSKLDNLRFLDELNGDLSNESLIENYNFQTWLDSWKKLSMALSHEEFTISSFELMSSGTIEVLLKIFNDERFGGEGSICRNAFMHVFHGSSFEVLVAKLQESLTRSEMFDILQSGLKTGENRALSLGKQLKIKLVAVDDEDQVFASQQSLVILAHAISSVVTISAFLKRTVENPFGFASRIPQTSNDWYVEFFLDDEVIPLDTTLFAVLYKQEQSKDKNFDMVSFWDKVHEVKFRRVEGTMNAVELDARYPEVEDDLSGNTSSGIRMTTHILDLLKALHGFSPDSSLFLNFKLTAKLKRQLEEPLIVASGILPTWSINITRKYPFLFPIETRIFFLQSTSFGHSRLIQLWNNRANLEQGVTNNNSTGFSNTSNLSLGRQTRCKVRVSRNHLLKGCYKILDQLGSNPSLLEIEFTDEVGSGLGPTLEFYATVSHLFARKKLGIWKQDHDDEINKAESYIHNKLGLFPVTLDPKDSQYAAKLDHFKYVGKFLARALLDNRIVDMNFNKLFFVLTQLFLNDPDYKLPPGIALEKLKFVDHSLYDSLKFLVQNRSHLEDLELNFTLPGNEGIELVTNGTNISVTSENVDDYVERVVDLTIGSGIREQVESFIVGFSEVFPFFAMSIFSPEELTQLLGSYDEDWSYETLIGAVHPAHGYSLESPTIQNLISLMTRFEKDQRRLFLQFMTGSPRLPVGGFKKLRPEFTVVLKGTEGGLKPDDYLPSVMTCANYLKLPNYSSFEMLEKRLLQAAKEGAGSFLLS